MPELRAYVDDSPKSGFYILANVGGPHPITIQVTDLGEQILQKAGYNEGDNVPTKVVWSMFDIGILYTSGTINDPPETVDNPDETFRQLGVANELTAQEQDQLLSYLDEYMGPNQTEVDDLRDTLENSTTETNNGTTMPEDVQNDLNRLSNLYERGDLTSDEYDLLKSRILDNISSTSGSHGSSDVKSQSDPRQETVQPDLEEKFREIVPEDKYDDSSPISFEDTSTDDVAMITVFYSPDEGGFWYLSNFFERTHEEHMFELLEDSQWELLEDNSDVSSFPTVRVERKSVQNGFQGELSSEYIRDEVSHFLELVQNVYKTDISDLSIYNQ